MIRSPDSRSISAPRLSGATSEISTPRRRMLVTAGVTANSYIIDKLCHRSWEKGAIGRLILLLMKRPVSIALFAALLLGSFATAAAQEMAGVVPVKAAVNDSSGASAPVQALTEIYRVGVGDA